MYVHDYLYFYLETKKIQIGFARFLCFCFIAHKKKHLYKSCINCREHLSRSDTDNVGITDGRELLRERRLWNVS